MIPYQTLQAKTFVYHTFNTSRVPYPQGFYKLHCNHTNKVTLEEYTVLYQHIGFIACCSYVSFVCMSCFYPVALCIVMFCCFPLIAVGDILFASAYFWAIFSEWGFVPPLVFEALSSCCIKALSLFSIMSLRPHIILRLCPHICEASSSYFILRLHSHILFGVFVLIFAIEALSS